MVRISRTTSGEVGSGSVPDTIPGGFVGSELPVAATDGEEVTVAPAFPNGIVSNANMNTNADLRKLRLNIRLSPLQRDLRCAETRNSRDQKRPFAFADCSRATQIKGES
jgi:hypothetical protein